MDIPKSERTANPSLNEKEMEICKGYNCYVGEITNGKQFANLTIKRSREIFQNLNPVSETGI